jgi:hypothetical protein
MMGKNDLVLYLHIRYSSITKEANNTKLYMRIFVVINLKMITFATEREKFEFE